MQQAISLISILLFFWTFSFAAELRINKYSSYENTSNSHLQGASGAIAISEDTIESVYVSVLEASLDADLSAQIGALEEGKRWTLLSSAPLEKGVVEVPRANFAFNEAFNFSSHTEIAYEKVSKEQQTTSIYHLSDAEITLINDALLFSQIRGKFCEPKEFDINLE